jgi:hypothetical protein
MNLQQFAAISVFALSALQAGAQGYNKSKFHQLEELLPTPTTYRTASGAPGHEYWQQKADYTIKVILDDEKQTLTGSEVITYTNNSPDNLSYIWLQLDQNLFDKNSSSYAIETTDKIENMSFDALERFNRNKFDGGDKIRSVKDSKGNNLIYTINKTMMRIELPAILKSKNSFQFSIDWFLNINNTRTHMGRGGYEFFEKDGNYLYEIAQWFPRMCVYNDVNGWQHKQYLGQGEFALPFGDYNVSVTVPSDHIVAATGQLQNPGEVLTSEQQSRFNKAKTADRPVIIVTQDEAIQKEKTKATGTKTWVYEAKNVRDFAWASSRKFIWDAMNVKIGNRDIMAMSYYPKEGNPLWEKFSTHSVAHTLKVYSKYTINYPYQVAISVNGPINGMEYPMICFNGPRPDTDGTYSDRSKYALISVVIHEVGHNFFPMIVNSDERQWTWMDEGLNSFCEYLAEKEWEPNYPARRGEPLSITSYMASDKSVLEPIMTNSESLIQFGNNAYAKTATALNILRETVMGRELFDYAFKHYAERWAFKHPMPADFFRTMEDASGVDLDWFWRGWFYSTDACDINLKNVTWYSVDSQNPEIEKLAKRAKKAKEPATLARQQDETFIKKTRVDEYPELADFYTKYDALEITDYDREKYKSYLSNLTDKEKQALDAGLNYYILEFENIGGLIMPLIVEMEYADGSKEVQRIPAEIWRKNNDKVSKLIVTNKEVKQFTLDPFKETADIDTKNNYFPRKLMESKFQLFKQEQQQKPKNLMQQKKEGKL